MAQRQKLGGFKVSRGEESKVRDQTGKDVTKAYDKAHRKLERLLEELAEEHEGLKLDEDFDVASSLARRGWKAETNVQKLAEWNLLDFYFAGPTEQQSVVHNLLEFLPDAFGDDEYFVHDQRGYAQILEPLLARIEAGKCRMLLNKRVTKVTYGETVRVDVVDQETGEPEAIEGSAVLMTVSVGVLNANLIEFKPPLPSWKTQALRECRMGLFCKVMLTFDTPFWNSKDDYIFIASDQKGYFSCFKCVSKLSKDQPHQLLGFVVDQEAA